MPQEQYRRPIRLPDIPILNPQRDLVLPPPRSPFNIPPKLPTQEQFKNLPPEPPKRISDPQIPKRVKIVDDDGNFIIGSDGKPLERWDVPIERPARPMEDAPPTTKFFEDRPAFKDDPLGFLTNPITTIPSQLAKPIADWIDQPTAGGDYDRNTAWGQVRQNWDIQKAQAKGMGAGMIQAIGDLMSSATSPADLAATLAFGGQNIAAKHGLKQIAKGLGLAGKLTSAPVAIHGGKTMLDPNASLTERLFGLAEFAGGTAGVLHTPTPDMPKPKPAERPFVPGFEYGPDGALRPIPKYEQGTLDFGHPPEPIQKDLPFGERPPQQPKLPGTELPELTYPDDPFRQQPLPLEGGAAQPGLPFGDSAYGRMGASAIPNKNPIKAPPPNLPPPSAPGISGVTGVLGEQGGQPFQPTPEPFIQQDLPFGEQPPPQQQPLPFEEPTPPVYPDDPYVQQDLPLEGQPQLPLDFATPGNLQRIGQQSLFPNQPTTPQGPGMMLPPQSQGPLQFPNEPLRWDNPAFPPPNVLPEPAPPIQGPPPTQPPAGAVEGPLGPEPPPRTDPYGGLAGELPPTRGNLNDPNYVAQLTREAESLGLNPRHYNPQELEEAVNVVKTFSGQGHVPITPEHTPDSPVDISEATIDRFPPGGQRTIADVARQLSVNTGDVPFTQKLLEQAGKMIYSERSPDRIRENFRVLDDLVKQVRMRADQSPDVLETIGRLRDDALDKMRRPHAVYEPDDYDISEALTPEGKTVMGLGNVRDMIALIKKAFSGHTTHVATKELLQNAIDEAAHPSLKGKGKILVNYSDSGNFIEVIDNGRGLTKQQLQTVFIDEGSSGKRGGEVETIGEMGLGKTSYLTTGKDINVVTVTKEGGKLMQHEFTATPEQAMAGGFDIQSSVAEPGTPTGTKVRYNALPEDSMDQGLAYIFDLKNYTGSPVPIEFKSLDEAGGTKFKLNIKNPEYNSKPFAELENEGGKYTLKIPDEGEWKEQNSIYLVLSNRGMLQSKQFTFLGGTYKVPPSILVEINPKVSATHPEYPLISPTRAALTEKASGSIMELINKEFINNQITERKAELARIFHQLVPPKGKSFTIADRHGVYTPEELAKLQENPALERIAQIANKFLTKMSEAFKDRELGGVKHFGYVLDEKTRGINVKEPGGDSFVVMLNPHTILQSADNPVEMANAVVHLLMHEYTHTIVREEGKDFTAALATVATKFGPVDQLVFFKEVLDAVRNTGRDGGYNPAIQEILSGMGASRGTPKSNVNTLFTQEGSSVPTDGGQGKTNVGAGLGGEGTDSLRVKNATPAAIMHLESQGYEFKGKLSDGTSIFIKYPEGQMPSGRPPILETPLGNQRATPSAAAGKAAATGGKPPIEPSFTEKAFQLPRSLMAAWDMSAPLRQGIGLIHKKEFWQALGPMFRSYGSERLFDEIQKSIYTNPKTGVLFSKRKGRKLPNGEQQWLPSFAEDAGLKLMDLGDDLTTREEAISSKWAEQGLTAREFHPSLQKNIGAAAEFGSKAYKHTLGSMVRRGNRAYTAFLNKLRADTFASLIQDAGIITGEKMVPEQIQLAKDLANFVNTATGRGSLGSLEQSAKTLNYTLFAPRLIAARLQMLNPAYYWAAPKQVRMEALKSLAAIAGVGNALGWLATSGGAEVGNNPNSSDFGKIKIGDTRIDPYGGFQQYIVAFNRLGRPNWMAAGPGDKFQSGITPLDTMMGYLGEGGQVSKSSTSNKEFDLWNPQSAFQPTQWDVLERFGRGKLNPVLGFAMSLMKNQTEMSGEKMDFSTLNPMENAIMQRFLPIITQDLYELSQKNPSLMPILGPASFFGMSSQTYGDVGSHHKEPWR